MKVLLLVIDGFGLGAFPDALNKSEEIYGKILKYGNLPTFSKLGIINLNNPRSRYNPMASYGYLKSMSEGTDIITLYFELMGLHIRKTYPTYPSGLPKELIDRIEKELATNIIGNIVVDGQKVISDLGALHYNTGYPIIYTSPSSVMYVAAHEEIMPLSKLYEICSQIRQIMQGEHNIARVMASPFNGKVNDFYFTDNNKCYSVLPPAPTLLDVLEMRNIDVYSIGKIYDIFNGQGITQSYNSREIGRSFDEIIRIIKQPDDGLIFASIETADLSRDDDVKVYTECVEEIDYRLGELMPLLNPEDLLIITSNHSYISSDESRMESGYMIPMIIYGGRIKSGVNLNTVEGLYSVAHTILDFYNINVMKKSFLSNVSK